MTGPDRHDHEAYRHPWLGVEVRHLATLGAVARTRSFRQAASELGYVQSAVSQQITRLERVVGTRLVERQRGQRAVRLTRAGELLAHRGERILGELQAARIDLDERARGGVRVGVARDMEGVLARLLAAVHEDLPGVPIQVREAVQDEQLVPLLEQGALDLAIGVLPAAATVSSVMLLHDPFVLLAAPGSRLAGVSGVSGPAELAQERLIVPASVLSQGYLRAPGLRLDRALEVPLASAVPPLVAQGHGVGLVPRSAVDAATGGVACVSAVGLIAPQRVVLGWHGARRHTATLETFCAAAVRAFAEDDRPERVRAA